MRVVAFIPARGGSKGIPGKNKKLFHGKPLVQWSIEQAKDAKIFDRIIVSSDDEEILKIAEGCGVETHNRSADLSGDATSLDEVLYYYFTMPGNECDFICMLQPTSPLRTAKDIKDSFKYVKLKRYWSVVGVTWNPIMGWVKNVARQGKKETNAALYLINDRPNRQNRDNFYLENGAIYWMRTDMLLKSHNRIVAPTYTYLYEMPPERSIDLDDEYDWYIAEKSYEYIQARV